MKPLFVLGVMTIGAAAFAALPALTAAQSLACQGNGSCIGVEETECLLQQGVSRDQACSGSADCHWWQEWSVAGGGGGRIAFHCGDSTLTSTELAACGDGACEDGPHGVNDAMAGDSRTCHKHGPVNNDQCTEPPTGLMVLATRYIPSVEGPNDLPQLGLYSESSGEAIQFPYLV